jgi:steroid delta-isomerase-like uncharacterized protein
MQIRACTHDNTVRFPHHVWQQNEAGAIGSRRLLVAADQTISLIRRMVERAFNQGSFAVVDELVPPNGIAHTSTWGIHHNRDGLKQLIAILRAAFPDLHCTVEDEINQDNKVAAHWTMRGTHTGVLLGNRPTGRPIVVQGMFFACTKNGQIVEGWMLLDQMGILQQLGIVPPPHGR